MNILQRIQSLFRRKPDLEFIAGQLRKPSGNFAGNIAAKMNQVNEPLYDFVLKNMKINDGDSILEIGFGSGLYMERLFSKAKNLKVAGIDYSAEMVDMAKEHNAAWLEDGQLDLRQGSSDALPFGDNTFDKVFCNMVIFFWDQPEKHLSEILRVLKPKGKFYTGFRTRKSMMQLPFTEYGFRLYEPEEWGDMLKNNRFSVLGVRRQMDPEYEENGKTIRLESVCMVGESEK